MSKRSLALFFGLVAALFIAGLATQPAATAILPEDSVSTGLLYCFGLMMATLSALAVVELRNPYDGVVTPIWAGVLLAVSIALSLPQYFLPQEDELFPAKIIALIPLLVLGALVGEFQNQKPCEEFGNLVSGFCLALWSLEAPNLIGYPLWLFGSGALLWNVRNTALGSIANIAFGISLGHHVYLLSHSDYRRGELMESLQGDVDPHDPLQFYEDGLSLPDSHAVLPGANAEYLLDTLIRWAGPVPALLIAATSFGLLVWSMLKLYWRAPKGWNRTVGILANIMLLASLFMNWLFVAGFPVNPGWGVPYFSASVSLMVLQGLVIGSLWKIPKTDGPRRLRLIVNRG